MLKKWLEKRYKILLESFQDSPFRFDDAAKLLWEKNQDSVDQINVILSELRKGGWLQVEFDPEDNRKRVYKLNSPEKVISQMLFTSSNQLSRGDLESLLKKAADLIRTRVDYTFILFLLFYKRICDKWYEEYSSTLQETIDSGLSNEEAKDEAKNRIYHDFDIQEDYLWENIRKEPARLAENFSKAMKHLAERNPELKDVFENVDFIQFTTNRENSEILRQLVELFSSKSLQHVSPDILGDAYEWVLKYFAPQKAKEGEVYTPREVISLIIDILDPKPGESVYDPAMGSAGMLIISHQHVENSYGKSETEKLFLWGQEANHKTIALAEMNLYIHDIRNAKFTVGDTLLYPKFKDEQNIQSFEVVIANPPWNQDGYSEETLKKGEFCKLRFNYGFPPNQSADWAWIQHMLASAKDETGRVGVVIDNGCLFRGRKEKSIRAGVINDDLLDTVILLPEKLFYNTGAPGAILIFNKNKTENRKNKILFINASKDYEQHPEVRKLNRLGDSHIEKIVKTYKEFTELEGFSRVVTLDEIKKEDYNLNVTLFVFPEEEKEIIDVVNEWKEIATIEAEIKENEKLVAEYLRDLYA